MWQILKNKKGFNILLLIKVFEFYYFGSIIASRELEKNDIG